MAKQQHPIIKPQRRSFAEVWGIRFTPFFARWITRTLLTIGEVFLIGYVIYLLFGGGTIAEEMMNALSVVLGALMLNFGKASSYWFSTESNFEDEMQAAGKKLESQKDG